MAKAIIAAGGESGGVDRTASVWRIPEDSPI